MDYYDFGGFHDEYGPDGGPGSDYKFSPQWAELELGDSGDDDDNNVAHYLDDLSIGRGAGWPSFLPDLEDTVASSLAIEVMGLPSCLAEHMTHHEHDAAMDGRYTLSDSFIADLSLLSASKPSTSIQEWIAPPIFAPEAPCRVAAEVSAVTHMLGTAAFWLASVNIESVPPAVQEEILMLAETCVLAALRFPNAAVQWGDLVVPPATVVGAGTSPRRDRPSEPAHPRGASSSSTQGRCHKRRCHN